MSGKNTSLRALRAWACFHLAEKVLPLDEFPRDEEQVTKESLEIPDWDEVLTGLLNLEKKAETEALQVIMKS